MFHDKFIAVLKKILHLIFHLISTGPRTLKHCPLVILVIIVLTLKADQWLVLAVQNMEASGTIAKDQEIEFNALCGSLSMMSKGTSSNGPFQ